MDPRQIDADVTGCAAAHQRLLAALDDPTDPLTDSDVGAPSLLPGWTVGHVLTHLARNADGVRRMVEGACRSEIVDQYPGGVEGRDADIAAGASRSAAELVADVRSTIYALEAAFVHCTAEGWAGSGRGVVVASIPVAQMPRRRWREVEVHHADLGLGVTTADWSADFVRTELASMTRTWMSRRPMGMTELPPSVLALAPNDRLAWFLGRLHLDGIDDAGMMS